MLYEPHFFPGCVLSRGLLCPSFGRMKANQIVCNPKATSASSKTKTVDGFATKCVFFTAETAHVP